MLKKRLMPRGNSAVLSFRIYFDNTPFKFYCEVCQAHVMDSSKHCGQCNRCVNDFDHHCRWLNNCVGKRNYMLFFRLICVFFLMCVLHIATNIAVIYYLASDKKTHRANTDKFYNTSSYGIFIGFLVAAIVFNALGCMFLGHLISFHIFLQRKKLTTFEYL